MFFPIPDTGVEAFPAADSVVEVFPWPGGGVDHFPPMPTPHIFVAVSLTLSPVAVLAVLPWRTADAGLALTPSALMSAAVEVDAPAGLTMAPIAGFVPDELFPAPGLELTPTAQVTLAALILAAPALNMTAGIAGLPVAVVTADAITTLSVSVSVAVAGIITAPVVLTMTPQATPVPVLTRSANTAFTMSPDAALEVITFLPSGMNKNGNVNLNVSNTTLAHVTNWLADTTTFPGSALSGHGLVVQGESDNATIAISWPTQNTGFVPSTVVVDFRVNGTTILEAPISNPIAANTTATITASTTGVTLNDGDVVTVWARTGSNGAQRVLQSGAWLRITEP